MRSRAPIATSAWRVRAAWVSCFAVVVLAGCSTALIAMSGFLTPEEARNYAALKPYEFVKRRFFTEEQGGVLKSVANTLEAVNKAIPGEPSPTRISSTERRRAEAVDEANMVTWPAYFTDENYLQLLRPKADLKRYCEAREGKFKTLSADRTDPLQFVRVDPQMAFDDAYARVTRSLAAQGAFVGYEELRGRVATNVGNEIAIESKAFNRSMESLFSAKGYQMAQKLEGFGTFLCESKDGSTWAASVFSTTLYARQANNSLTSSMSRLAITVYAPKAKTVQSPG